MKNGIKRYVNFDAKNEIHRGIFKKFMTINMKKYAWIFFFLHISI